jgi:hypothetical protein
MPQENEELSKDLENTLTQEELKLLPSKNQMNKKKHNGISKDILNTFQVLEKSSFLIEVGTIDRELNP